VDLDGTDQEQPPLLAFDALRSAREAAGRIVKSTRADGMSRQHVR
jgi:hypothetical protein